MNNTQKNIIAVSVAIAFIGIAFHFIQRHDEQVLNGTLRYGSTSDTIADHFTQATDAEKRIALQFTNTTLPQLRRLGLVKSYTRTELDTVITVSGKIWNERSQFFKESLLEQIFVYNSVNGFALTTKIIDERTSELYAEITPPNRRDIY